IEAQTETDSNVGKSLEHIHSAKLSLTNISFSYPDSVKKQLDNISLTIPQGKKVALLGRSGMGKSTLLKLIAGVLQPDEGSIKVNDYNISASGLGSVVSVLNQKPHLFDTTIKHNIKISRPNATDDDINECIEKAQLTELINQLPDGLNTEMEELGKRFSGGERQRIAFARVLLQDTPIILLDEPTIGL